MGPENKVSGVRAGLSSRSFTHQTQAPGQGLGVRKGLELQGGIRRETQPRPEQGAWRWTSGPLVGEGPGDPTSLEVEKGELKAAT